MSDHFARLSETVHALMEITKVGCALMEVVSMTYPRFFGLNIQQVFKMLNTRDNSLVGHLNRLPTFSA